MAPVLMIREPLFWFFLVGVALFVLERVINTEDADALIEISPQVETRIADQWQTQLGRAPTAEEQQGLIDQWLKEEIYYREAKRLNLDDNDTIVRRRLVQKLTFLTEDLATAVEPTDAELEDFFADRKEQYAEPARYSFEHRYFSADRRPQAQADAAQALAELTDQDAEGVGDPFMLQSAFAERSQRQIADLFGRGFAEALVNLDTQGWAGPIQSAYGWHLVQLQAQSSARLLPLDEVRARVLADYTLERRAQANDAYYQQLRSRYRITKPEAPIDG